MKKLNQSGFAVLHGLLALIIIGLIIGTGWYVWNSQKETDAALEASNTAARSSAAKPTPKQADAGDTCKAGTEMEGKMFSMGDGVFSFCQPNGWKLLHTEVPGAFFADQIGISYNEDIEPTTEMTGGSDKNYEFSVYDKVDEQAATQGFTKKSSTKTASGLTVDTYYHMTTGDKDPVGAGIGYQSEGTEQFKYIVTKNDRKLVFSYDHLMQARNLSSDIQAVVNTTL